MSSSELLVATDLWDARILALCFLTLFDKDPGPCVLRELQHPLLVQDCTVYVHCLFQMLSTKQFLFFLKNIFIM